MIKYVKIVSYQVGLVIKDREIVKILTQGRHWVYGNAQVFIYEMKKPFTPIIDIDVLLKNDKLGELLHVIDIKDNEIVLKYIDDKFEKVLTKGKYAYWKNGVNYNFQRINLDSYEIDKSINKSVLKNISLNEYVRSYAVMSYHKGLLFVDGVFKEVLSPGVHYYWNSNTPIEIKTIDIRTQEMEISGQEILTKDKASIRLNFDIHLKIVDPIKAVVEIKDVEKQLYNLMQLSLRAYVGTMTLDELLAQKQTISDTILENNSKEFEALGVNVINAGIKDIILPGDMKEIMNQVLLAEKKAQANSIMRREETAATRSLLNTSKLMEENSMLWKLKEMEYVEKIADKIGEISITGGSNAISQLKEIFIK